jgi:hypothetical protein
MQMNVSGSNRSPRALSTTRLAASLFVAVALAGACDKSTAPAALASIVVTPDASLAINATQQFVAVGKDVNGKIKTISPTWSVVAGGGAINTGGLFTAGTVAGTFAATVKATSGTISGTASVTVLVGSLATITVSPKPDTLAINGTRQFVAVGKDIGGNVVTITPTWSVAAGGGAVSASGLFTAGTTAGTYTNTVVATSGTVSGTSTVVVTAGALATIAVTPNPAPMAINATQQFTAIGKDVGNNVVAISPVWSVVASGGTINSTGLFTAGAVAGTYTNTAKATSGAISGTATVTVTAGALATIAVTPSAAVLAKNATQQYTAVGKDAGNNVVAITPVWSVVASGGSINSTGLFTAGAVAGTYTNTVKATSGLISGTATVNVTSGNGLAPVLLGAAGNYVILAKSAISTVPTSAITGDLGLSPAAASFITGFSLILPAGGAFSTSSQVTGNVYAADYAVPTPTNLTTAVSDMQTAYTDAAGRPTPDFSELNTGAIGGLTLPAGLYKWTNTVTISSDVTLNGSATDVWIFQISGGITQASATQVFLTGGALAKNVFWQVFGVVDIGTTAHMEGIILSQTSITLATGASANGRLLAQTAVSLAGNMVVQPAP